MIPTIRAIARLCVGAVAIMPFLPAAPSYAANVVYVSGAGSGTSCTVTAPCPNIVFAIANNEPIASGFTQVICSGPVVAPDNQGNGVPGGPIANSTFELDCPLGFLHYLSFTSTNTTGRLRDVTFTSSAFTNEIQFQGSGTLILENCTFVDDSHGAAIDIEPNGPLNLVIRNSRVSSSASGILLKPAAGGSINAMLDHVTIADNSGGGLKVDTTNGAVTVDITDSVVSNNGGNGINAVGIAGGQVMVSIKNSVIAKNAVAGVQANGANTGVLISTTLFDQNATGATSIVNGGNLLTYGNNNIVGSAGSGFNGTAPLHQLRPVSRSVAVQEIDRTAADIIARIDLMLARTVPAVGYDSECRLWP